MLKIQTDYFVLTKRILVGASLLFIGIGGIYAETANGLGTSTNAVASVNQQKRITGVITDTKGETVIGANVVQKGTTNATITDIDGKFSLNVPNGALLEVTCVGYLNFELKIGDQTSYTIQLKEKAQTLDEVVVVAYGSQKKVNLTGSVSSVNMSDLVDSRPITNLSSGLAGVAAGVQVSSSSNRPGNDNASILIRGQGTLNNSAPLVIIDGVEGNISNVNPQDIENLSVLKDAASAAIYGSRAANGVLLITTKQGKAGAVKLDYNGYLSFESIGKTIETVSNYADYMELVNEGKLNSNLPAIFSQGKIDLWRANENGDQLLYPNTDWVKGVFKTSVATNHNLSISGGTDKVRFYTAVGYMNNPGVMENSGFNKINFRSNVEGEVKKWLKLGTNLSGYYAETEPGTNAIDDVFTYAAATTPGMSFRSPDGRYGGMNNEEDDSQAANNNPLRRLNNIDGQYTNRNLKARFFGTIAPVKGLSVTGSYTYELTDQQQQTKPVFIDCWNFITNQVTLSGTSRSYLTNYNSKQQRNFMDAVAKYETKINKLDLNVMLGASQEQYRNEWFQAKKLDLIDMGLGVLDGAVGDASASGNKTEWAMQSYFGRVNLGWESRYLLELNIRRDGSSRFLSNQRWGYFPSVSAAWRIDQEPFMEKFASNWLSNLKLRASYGSLGNNAVGNYDALSVYATTNYILNNALATGLSQTAIANANLTWESTNIADIGLDFGAYNNKLTGTVDYFYKKTDGILIDLPAPLVRGNASIPKQNSAIVVNQGVELSLGWQDKIGDFSYFANGNITWLKNEVTKYKGDQYTISGNGLIKEGLPIKAQYVRIVDRIVQTDDDLALVQSIVDNAPIDPATGNKKNPFAYGRPQLGDLLYKDLNGDGLINDDDRKVVGNGPNPKFAYGLNLGAKYKGIDFSVMLQGVTGIKMYWLDGYYTPTVRWGYLINKEIADGRWYQGRTDATYPRLLDSSNTRNTQVSDFWMQNKSFFKIKNIQLGYSLPKELIAKLNIEKVRFYGSLENFFTFSSYKGMDPEVSGTNYPTMKQASVGINITF
ncbi:SusC/RagA family TonB-linked outer membrane protein [Bacteroides sedimenti]|uniref:SusC/RagA family TonB-linked outer membrane protein n=1 Tax=Bacteroides sedimenti TaxID=2136147 RepID=A0ABN6Z6V5_9BACE